MVKRRITKEELGNSLAKLPLNEGIEAKFYKASGTVVVTFENRAGHDRKSNLTFRIGRKSPKRFHYTDIDTAWNILTIKNHLDPPKGLLTFSLPQNMGKKHVAHRPEHEDANPLRYEEKNYCDVQRPIDPREIAYQEAECRIEDYNNRKENFCHGIGLRKIKLFLNACIKAGDEVAQLYRYALEAEGENIRAKKSWHKYHAYYYAYDNKEDYLSKLADMCMRLSFTFGIQDSDVPAAQYVVYFELPSCEQISFHTNADEAYKWPKYQGKWDGKKCSTMEKLEAAIWSRYETRLRERYEV